MCKAALFRPDLVKASAPPLTPAEAGVQFFQQKHWVPAYAGTSGKAIAALHP
jgi:hypothetical protein